jgi:hypothetical protein
LKDSASQDPLGKREETNKNTYRRKATHYDDDDGDGDDEPEYEGDTDADDGSASDDDIFFDSEDEGSNKDDDADEAIDGHGYSDSGYNSDGTDITITEDTEKCYTTKTDEFEKPQQKNLDAAEPGEFKKVKRKCKALCYEDICFWIVQNPRRGERDILAIEVYLQNHKGVDNKPKPYITSTKYLES